MERTVEHGGNLWAASERYGLQPEEFVDFSANINPLGPSPKAIEAIEQHLMMIKHYPSPTSIDLKIALANYLKIDAENLVLGNGATELIYLLSRMYGMRRILLLTPCFTEYGRGVINPEIVWIPLQEEVQYALPVKQIIDTLKEGDLLFVGNPNNPTARLFTEQDLLKIQSAVKAIKAHLVIDEAFMDFTGQSSILRQVACREESLTVLGSLTKFFALPGLRIGYAVAARSEIDTMEKLLPPWRLNSMAQWAAQASLQDEDYICQTLTMIPRLRMDFIQGLRQIKDLQVYDSDTNFLLLNSSGLGVSAEELQSKLGPEGLLIRTCNDYYGLSPYHFRLAVRSQEENYRMIMSLKNILDN